MQQISSPEHVPGDYGPWAMQPLQRRPGDRSLSFALLLLSVCRAVSSARAALCGRTVRHQEAPIPLANGSNCFGLGVTPDKGIRSWGDSNRYRCAGRTTRPPGAGEILSTACRPEIRGTSTTSSEGEPAVRGCVGAARHENVVGGSGLCTKMPREQSRRLARAVCMISP